jgi:hypothetical protein
MDLRDLAARAKELGHVGDVDVRGPWPEHGEIHAKYYVRCSCGWEFKAAVRSERNAIRWVVFHLGKAVGERDEVSQRNGVSVPPVTAIGHSSAS